MPEWTGIGSSAAKVGIVIEADDQTKRGFSSASKGADNLKRKFAGLKREASGMPEKFSKATAALFLFQGGLGRAGGAAADMANKVVAVAALMVTGGPLGIALAAVTGLIAVLSAAWDKLTEDTQEAAAATEMMEGKLKTLGKQIEENNRIAREMNIVTAAGGDAMELFMEKSEAAIGKAQTVIAEAQKERAKLWATERRDLLAAKDGIEKLNVVANARYVALGKEIERQKEVIESTNNLREAELGKAAATHETAIAEEKGRRAADKGAALAKAEAAAKKQAASDAASIATFIAEIEAERVANAKATAEAIIGYEELIAQRKREIAESNQALQWQIQDDQRASQELAGETAAAQAERQIDLLEQSTVAAGDAFAAYANGSATAEEAMSQLTTSFSKMIFQMAVDRLKAAAIETAAETAKSSTVITASAAEGAAKAGAAHAGIPFVGLAIALAAAVAMQAMLGGFDKFHYGGMATGGSPGTDSIPAMLEPGEFVLPTETVNKIKGQPRGNSITNNNNNAQAITLNVQSRPGQSFSYRDIRGLERELADVQRRAVSRGGVV